MVRSSFAQFKSDNFGLRKTRNVQDSNKKDEKLEELLDKDKCQKYAIPTLICKIFNKYKDIF